MTGVTGRFDFAQTFADMGVGALVRKRAPRVHKATQQAPCSPVVKVMSTPSPSARYTPTIPAAVPQYDFSKSVLAVAVGRMYSQFGKILEEKSLQKVRTPFELCLEILSKLEITQEKTFLVVSAIEFIVVLIDVFKVPKENIFFLDEGGTDGTIGPSVKSLVVRQVFGFCAEQVLSVEDVEMKKFDFVVGNPPFSTTNPGKQSGKRSVVLYPEFYKKAVGMADTVAMIMPDTTNYASSAHNDFLIETNAKAYSISDDMHNVMGIIIKTWYVISSKADDTLSNIEFSALRDDCNDLPIQKGKINLSTVEHSTTQDDIFSVPVIKGMTRRGTEMRYIRLEDAKFALSSGKYAVVFPLCVQPHGWSHIEIIEGCGQCFNINTFYIEASSSDEAKKLAEIISSDDFIAQANTLKGNSGTMGLEKFKKIKI